MKKNFLTSLFFLGIISSVFAQTKVMQITTVESIIPGGLGRSRMIVTDESGKQTESEMKNFYSMVGINLENIQSNDVSIVKIMNKYTSEGWKIAAVNSSSQSPNEQYPQGIFISRYLLTKE